MKIRHLDKTLKDHFSKYKQAIILLGARQVGKTTILKKVFSDAQYLLMDNDETKTLFEAYDINTYKQLIGQNKQIILDELHLLSEPGRAVKILYDQVPNIQIIVTGSSSLHIKNKSGESMAGRKFDYYMYPLTFSEYLVQLGIQEELNYNIINNIFTSAKEKVYLFSRSDSVKRILLYGLYPEIIQQDSPIKYLLSLSDTSIFKDIVELNLIEDKAKAKLLLKLLSYQIGNLVNYSEIAEKLEMDSRTVQRYIDIFEQSYILYRIYPFSRNKRREIGKMPKIYFYDLGLRNALINDFSNINLRSDSGAMFENFIFNEVIKSLSYSEKRYEVNYWRTRSGSEVDLIISNNQEVYGCEIKQKKGRVSRAFTDRYPEAKTRVITMDNFY